MSLFSFLYNFFWFFVFNLCRSVKDIAKVLSEGYSRCLERVSVARFDISGHSFDDYVCDYAASNSLKSIMEPEGEGCLVFL